MNPPSLSIPASRSILSPRVLLDVVAREYALGAPRACTFLGPTTNDHYLVETSEGRYVLRVYRAMWRSASDVGYELDALIHLQRKGAPVSYPIPGRDGQLSRLLDAPEGARPAVLFSYAPGRPRARDGLDEPTAAVFGSLLADLHAATDDFTTASARPALDLTYLLDQPLARIRPYLENRPEDWDDLIALAERLRRWLAPLAANLAWGFCHGDFHGWNLHVADDGVVTAFDFDCCGPGWRAYDLATFCHNLGLRSPESPSWPAFLRGYTERRRPGEADLAAIPIFVALRELWLLGVRAANVPDWGILWLDDRFDRGIRFLKEWEAAYFSSANGP